MSGVITILADSATESYLVRVSPDIGWPKPEAEFAEQIVASGYVDLILAKHPNAVVDLIEGTFDTGWGSPMGNIIPFPAKPTTDHYFGGCPKCGQSDGYINVGGNHFFVCDEHNAAWCIGYNVFSEWKDEPASRSKRAQAALNAHRRANLSSRS